MADDRNANDKPDQAAPTRGRVVKFRRADEARLRELGLWESDELVISLRPSRRLSSKAKPNQPKE
ncbi:MAG: hypothetical protein OXQ92_05540 [Boseongicola sp.]|nr:hypothetical protein [Boseongicola sp.]